MEDSGAGLRRERQANCSSTDQARPHRGVPFRFQSNRLNRIKFRRWERYVNTAMAGKLAAGRRSYAPNVAPAASAGITPP